MQKADNLNDRVGSGSEGSSIKNADPTLISVSHQQLLAEVGGEPLVGSGFENEEPETGFAQAGKES
jgi:hypothetical protein